MNTLKKNTEKPNTKSEGRPRHRILHWQVMAFLLSVYDFVMIHVAYFLALWARFDFIYSSIPVKYLSAYARFITIYTVGAIFIFYVFKLYQSVWRFASFVELERVVEASLLTSMIHIVMITLIFVRMPLTYYFFGMILQLFFVAVIRFSYRFILFWRQQHFHPSEEGPRVMVIGAGSAGQMLIHDMVKANETTDKPVCIIDDNPNKWNRFIDGVPVVGGRDDILAMVDKYNVEKIFFSIPSATSEQKRDILNICSETGCEMKQLPGIYQFILGEIKVSAMKDVSVEDLLGREPFHTDMHDVYDFIAGMTVLVTGAGGSIGSELCRQVAAHNPRMLVLFDIYENSVYDVQLELKEKYPELDMAVL
ncbi:MAG: polysaccharide biosynthesis protein, partial [Lachnospiraceae bacterium]|nr:polysaccharide biosynthesis protein [Lachnospiraceae bacterium]